MSRDDHHEPGRDAEVPLRICPDCGHDLQNCCGAMWPEHEPGCENYRPKKQRDYDRCPWCHQPLPEDWRPSSGMTT